MGKRRGQLTESKDRKEIIQLITEAQNSGARLSKACELIGLSTRTIQRWGLMKVQQDGRLNAQYQPKNKLTDSERQQIITIANQPEYAHMSPNKIVPALASKGVYVASESTFYRILKENSQLKHRNKCKPMRNIVKPKAFTATGPNQIYSWDISYLPTVVKGLFFYLYLVMDIFSRKIVGWHVHPEESSELASDLMIDICLREGISKDQVVLHSDNGSPMKGAALLATLQQLGVVPSFSRPSVSNDNPYSESLFRTLKYCPEYPEKAFETLASARTWVATFVQWYNNEHMHSSIKFVTPAQRHAGEDIKILSYREEVYKKAKLKHPERWSGSTRNWTWESEVHLNPQKESKAA